MMAPGVDDAITEVMRHDASGTVRATAIVSAGFRDVTAFTDALADAAVNDKDGTVRSAAVIALGRSIERAPRAREALVTAANKDPNADIRKQARALLERPNRPADDRNQ